MKNTDLTNLVTLTVADDHVMVRPGIENAVSNRSDLRLVDSVGTGKEAITSYQEERPDVLLLDYRLPDMNGPEVAQEILKIDPDAAILIHSAYEGEEDIWKATQTGIRGYLPKRLDISLVFDAIRLVAEGETFFPEDVSDKIQAREGRKDLSKREQQVLELLSVGMSNKQMTSYLSISEATVRHHVSNILCLTSWKSLKPGIAPMRSSRRRAGD